MTMTIAHRVASRWIEAVTNIMQEGAWYHVKENRTMAHRVKAAEEGEAAAYLEDADPVEVKKGTVL